MSFFFQVSLGSLATLLVLLGTTEFCFQNQQRRWVETKLNQMLFPSSILQMQWVVTVTPHAAVSTVTVCMSKSEVLPCWHYSLLGGANRHTLIETWLIWFSFDEDRSWLIKPIKGVIVIFNFVVSFVFQGAHFIELCCQRNIPLLFLQNITGKNVFLVIILLVYLTILIPYYCNYTLGRDMTSL